MRAHQSLQKSTSPHIHCTVPLAKLIYVFSFIISEGSVWINLKQHDRCRGTLNLTFYLCGLVDLCADVKGTTGI